MSSRSTLLWMMKALVAINIPVVLLVLVWSGVSLIIPPAELCNRIECFALGVDWAPFLSALGKAPGWVNGPALAAVAIWAVIMLALWNTDSAGEDDWEAHEPSDTRLRMTAVLAGISLLIAVQYYCSTAAGIVRGKSLDTAFDNLLSIMNAIGIFALIAWGGVALVLFARKWRKRSPEIAS